HFSARSKALRSCSSPAVAAASTISRAPSPSSSSSGAASRASSSAARASRSSARFGEGHPHYELARAVGGAFARAGYAVMTGGGPGIMEAANRGAKEAGGLGIGCNIKLPMEQQPNPYLDRFIGVRALLHPQGDAREALVSVRRHAGRL